MNIGVHASFQISVFIFSMIHRQDHKQVCFWLFEESSRQWLHQFTFLPIVQKSSLFSTSTLTFIICGLFDDSHFDRCEVISPCDSFCISMMINDVEHLFMCLVTICISSLEKCQFRFSVHFLIELVFFWGEGGVDIVQCELFSWLIY